MDARQNALLAVVGSLLARVLFRVTLDQGGHLEVHFFLHVQVAILIAARKLLAQDFLGQFFRAVHAQVAGQGTRIDLTDPDDARVVQVPLQASLGAPGRGDRGDLAHDESGYMESRGLDVLAVHTVVPDVGIRHGDNLAGIGGIGEDFLVAAEGGVEDDFPFGLPHPAQ